MTHTTGLGALAAVMAAAFCLATLAPTGSNEASAQIWAPGATYYNGYGAGYNPGLRSVYDRHTAGYGYTGYGSGPYGYQSSTVYVYPSPGGYGYRNMTTYGIYQRDLRFQGGAYRSIYSRHARYYSPYGIRGY